MDSLQTIIYRIGSKANKYTEHEREKPTKKNRDCNRSNECVFLFYSPIACRYVRIIFPCVLFGLVIRQFVDSPSEAYTVRQNHIIKADRLMLVRE